MAFLGADDNGRNYNYRGSCNCNFFLMFDISCWFLQAFDGHSLQHTMLILNSKLQTLMIIMFIFTVISAAFSAEKNSIHWVINLFEVARVTRIEEILLHSKNFLYKKENQINQKNTLHINFVFCSIILVSCLALAPRNPW